LCSESVLGSEADLPENIYPAFLVSTLLSYPVADHEVTQGLKEQQYI